MKILKENGKDTVMRVAGGWVRDKLIGKDSDDIDIALDNMLGQELAEMIAQRQNNKKGQKGYGLVKSNQEKAKNLEVVIINVEGHSIDIVNLRHEDYAGVIQENDQN